MQSLTLRSINGLTLFLIIVCSLFLVSSFAATKFYIPKSGGIQTGISMTFSYSRTASIQVTIMSKFSSTAHSSPRPENHLLCLSLPWRFVRTLLDLVATSWIYIDVDLVSRCQMHRCVEECRANHCSLQCLLILF